MRNPSHGLPGSRALEPAASPFIEARLCLSCPSNLILGRFMLVRDLAAMADNLRADLDQLFAQGGRRPRLRSFGRRQRAHKVAEIIGERVQLKADGIGCEGAAVGWLTTEFRDVMGQTEPIRGCAGTADYRDISAPHERVHRSTG
jgi:hypothetical protein